MPRSAIPGYYKCCKCRVDKPLAEYHKASRQHKFSSQLHTAMCKNCRSEKEKPESRRRRIALRVEVLAHYGGNPPKCACCGETEFWFLTFDHINGGGNKHRAVTGIGSVKLCAWLKRNGYPEGFRVLCSNCNSGRERNGGVCPHEERRQQQALAAD